MLSNKLYRLRREQFLFMFVTSIPYKFVFDKYINKVMERWRKVFVDWTTLLQKSHSNQKYCLGTVSKGDPLLFLLVTTVAESVCIEIANMSEPLDSFVLFSRLNMFYLMLFANGILYHVFSQQNVHYTFIHQSIESSQSCVAQIKLATVSSTHFSNELDESIL